jgi:tryptophan-rich hypothetical protein
MIEHTHSGGVGASRARRNTIAHHQLIGSKWTAITALERERHIIVTGWANAPTDCDGEPDSVIIETVHTGRSRVIAWRSLRNAQHWVQGWA